VDDHQQAERGQQIERQDCDAKGALMCLFFLVNLPSR
jgi:hypothetical protein